MNQANSRLEPDQSRYPSADEIPDVRADAAKEQMGPQPQGDMNPVVDALRTLQQFVLVAEQRGDANAAALKNHLVEFAKSMAGSSGTGEGDDAAEPVEDEPPAAPEVEGEQEPVDDQSEAMAQQEEVEGENEEQQIKPKRKLNKRMGMGNAVPMA